MNEALEKSMFYLISFLKRLKSFKKKVLVAEYEKLMKRHILFSRFIEQNVIPEEKIKIELKKSKLGHQGSLRHEEIEKGFKQLKPSNIVRNFWKKTHSIDLMLNLIQKELIYISYENDKHLKSLFRQLKNAYSESRHDSQIEYYSISPVLLKDLEKNYYAYFNYG